MFLLKPGHIMPESQCVSNLISSVQHHCATNSTHIHICKAKVYITRNLVAQKIKPDSESESTNYDSDQEALIDS